MGQYRKIPMKLCGECVHKRLNNDGGHCYMFKVEPQIVYCSQFKIDSQSKYAAIDRESESKK